MEISHNLLSNQWVNKYGLYADCDKFPQLFNIKSGGMTDGENGKSRTKLPAK
jgi:hypothetical protein